MARGERDGVAALHQRYVGRVYDFLYRTVRNRAEAAMLTRAVLVHALTELLLHPDPARDVRASLFSTARARAVERLGLAERRGETRPLTDAESQAAGFDVLGPAWRSPVGQGAGDDPGPAIWRAVAALPLRHYIVLDLHLRQGLTDEALAQALGVVAPVADHALVEAGRALLARTAPATIVAPGAPETPLEGDAGGPSTEPPTHDVWALLGDYLDPSELARLRDSTEGRLFAALAPVPMPVELKNTIWRDLAARWPDPDDLTQPDPRRAAPAAEVTGPGAPGAELGASAAPLTRGAEAPPGAAAMGSPTAEPLASEAETAPFSSLYVRSRAGGELLARTQSATLRGPAAPGSYGGSPLVVDEGALAPLSRPVRLRARGQGGMPRLLMLVVVLFVVGLGVAALVRGPELLAAILPESLAAVLPESLRLPPNPLTLVSGDDGSTPPTATPEPGEPTPTGLPPNTPAAGQAAAPAAETPAGGVQSAGLPTPTGSAPAGSLGTPSSSESGTPRSSGTLAAPTATITQTATITPTMTPSAAPTETPSPTDTPEPPKPTDTPRPTATRTPTPRPPPPPPPPTHTPTPLPPTDTPAPPTFTPTPARGFLIPVTPTPRR